MNGSTAFESSLPEYEYELLRGRDSECSLVVTLAPVVTGIYAISVDKECNLCIEPFQPTLI